MAWSTLAPSAEVAWATEAADTSAVVPIADTTAAVRTVGETSGKAADTSTIARARPATPDSAAVSRLALALAESPAARIGMGPRSYVVLHPRVERTGITFDGVEGFPPPRPAVIAMGKWDTVPPPPNPIPWSQVSSVDKRVKTRTPTTVYGAVVGGLFFAGTAFALGQWSEGEGGDATPAPAVLGIGLAGAVLGGLIGYLFESSKWVEEYPPPK
jgi:hypothetical protein